jgi:hypothetical protein
MSDLLETLKAQYRALKERDPLKDIPHDHVCVISPLMEVKLREQFRPDDSDVFWLYKLTGRRTYVELDAPDEVVYMSEEQAERRYQSVSRRLKYYLDDESESE